MEWEKEKGRNFCIEIEKDIFVILCGDIEKSCFLGEGKIVDFTRCFKIKDSIVVILCGDIEPDKIIEYLESVLKIKKKKVFGYTPKYREVYLPEVQQ